ncbi:MAG: hypothetical protein AAGA48_07625 [Myxococcota bacterium]
MTELPEPLFAEPLPKVAPTPSGESLLGVMQSAWEGLRDPDVDPEEVARRLDVARHAAYAHATAAMEDGWRLRRVVQVEEWTAELARRASDWSAAYLAWRTAFWIRHQAGDDMARAKLVLDQLRALRTPIGPERGYNDR